MLKLEGKKIYLREPRWSDSQSIYRHARDRGVSRYTHVPHPYHLEDAYRFLRQIRRLKRTGRYVIFAIVDKETDELIGLINIFDISRVSKKGEIGYWLGKKYWGKGIMTEAVQLVLKYCFRELRFQKVTARVWHPNIPSAKLLQKCGFKLEGRLRRHTYRNRRWYDDLMFGILKEEFRKKR
jgi:RimJ/RimL family protein N-acetyltransferase